VSDILILDYSSMPCPLETSKCEKHCKIIAEPRELVRISRNGEVILMSKEEKKKEEKSQPQSIPDIFEWIRLALFETDKTQKTICNLSSFQRITENSAGIASIFARSTEDLLALITANTEFLNLTMDQPRILEASQVSSQVFKGLTTYENNVRQLSEQFARVKEMIQTSVSIPILESEIETINLRAENSVNSLLNYIGLLERELKKREIENKDLLQRMDKVKKELRKQYDG
jgi:hypothetical protein